MKTTQDTATVETERIKSLKKYNILDTPPDGSFDRITKLAGILLEVPIAIVTLVDTDRIWFKSRYGIDVQQIGRDAGLCASAILSDEFYQVADTRTDPRTLANPLVASEFGLRFYAAVPLKIKEGFNLGTLCVLDKKPRHLTEQQKETLQYLADITVDQLELRLAARTAIYQQNQVLGIAAHDLKNPLTALSVWAQLTSEAKNNPEEVEKISVRIKDAANKMNKLVNDLLETAKKEAGKLPFKSQAIHLATLVESVVKTNEVLAINKRIQLQFMAKADPIIMGDDDRVTELADNLINNAIKYSPSGKNVYITITKETEFAVLQVKDEGQGLTIDDKKNLYQRFVKLSAKPTGGESSTGLGLSIVKSIADAHNGEIAVLSDGKFRGATFTVKLPLVKE